MSHHKYTTEALILSVASRREHDAMATLFTRDLGLIYARAQGLRKLLSKLRMTVVPHRFIRASVVQGRELWQLTNAEELYSMWGDWSVHVRLMWARISQFLVRFVPREEKNEALYDRLSLAAHFLARTSPDPNTTLSIECIVIIGALYELGYLGDHDSWKYVLEHNISSEMADRIGTERERALQVIHRSLQSTHL